MLFKDFRKNYVQQTYENNILYNKQFGFQKSTSTDHAILELVDELRQSFNENKFTVGVFIDLSKAFDTIDHKILISKLKHYSVNGNMLKWFWNDHIDIVEKKNSKSIGALYKAKFALDQKCLKHIYFAFIHSYINYANIAWASISHTNLKKLYNKQKHASPIIYNKDKFTHAKPLMKSLNALNVYQINIFQTLNLMFKSQHRLSSIVFQNMFKKVKT